MRQFRSNVLILLGFCVVAALAGLGAIVAGDKPGGKVDRQEKMKIVVVDEDGDRHEEVFEFHGEHPRPFLGVGLDAAEDSGARVDNVVEDSAAERAGLLEGDVIVAMDGEAIGSPRELTRAVLRSEVGDRVELEILRDGKPRTLTVELGQRQHGAFAFNFDGDAFEEQMEKLHEQFGEMDLDLDFDFDFDGEAFEEQMEQLHERLGGLGEMRFAFGGGRPLLGVRLVTVTPELREHLGAERDEGVLVGKVMDEMPAQQAGVRVGDLIVGVAGASVSDVGDLQRALRDKRGERFDLEVIRDGRREALSVELPESEASEDGDDFPGSHHRGHEPRHRALSGANRT